MSKFFSKKSIAVLAFANVTSVAASTNSLAQRWMNKANEKFDKTSDTVAQNGEEIIETSTCWSCIGGCCQADSFEDYYTTLGGKLLVGYHKDTVLQYRYYYCQTLPEYKEWKDYFTSSDSAFNRFRGLAKHFLSEDANGNKQGRTAWNDAYNQHWSIYQKDDKQARWEAHTGYKTFDEMDNASCQKKCGLTWEQYFFLRQKQNMLSSDEMKRDYGKQWMKTEIERQGVSPSGRGSEADYEAAWDKIAENRYLPEVTDEEKFWKWAGENQRAVKNKLLLN